MLVDKDFARWVYGEILASGAPEPETRLGTAQACLETGWGRDYPVMANNVWGIKPVGKQPYVVYKKSHIRVFPDFQAGVAGWRRLMEKSTHYAVPRAQIQEHLAMPEHVGDPAWTEAAWKLFGVGMGEIYCPGNPMYGTSLLRVWHNLEDSIWSEAAARAERAAPREEDF